MFIIEINSKYINDYKNIVQTTNLQNGYQEFIKFFRYLRTYLEKEMNNYDFTNNIVENNMDYSYFQFTNQNLKSRNLKIVIAFIHKKFKYEIWLSGINRKVQLNYFEFLKEKSLLYILTNNPNKTDYILKSEISGIYNYDDLEQLLIRIKVSIEEFVRNISQYLK